MTEPQPPEEMASFFDERAEGYDEHMRESVIVFKAFYESIASPIPTTGEALQILDIGCGTGLELDSIFKKAKNALVTGIDLSQKMLVQLHRKYNQRLAQIALIQGSYLEIPLEGSHYDFAVSVMTLHHLLPNRKKRLYKKFRQALKEGGKYIEGDYVVSKEKERQLIAEFRAKTEHMGKVGGEYHLDIPLSFKTQQSLLIEAGFRRVETVFQKGEAAVYVAEK
jgi:tRNA (cmo5U34)-methyltransferase